MLVATPTLEEIVQLVEGLGKVVTITEVEEKGQIT